MYNYVLYNEGLFGYEVYGTFYITPETSQELTIGSSTGQELTISFDIGKADEYV